MINKIYLHWTAGRYDQFFNDYHICIDGDGGVHRMADLETKLAHTWHRNSNAVGIALCCCYGAKVSKVTERITPLPFDKNDTVTSSDRCVSKEINAYHIAWGGYPPKEIQIVSMANCVAEICKEYGLPINKDTVMTHAEVASVDGYGVDDNDPDMRWDLLRLPGHNNAKGGDVVRQMARVLKIKD